MSAPDSSRCVAKQWRSVWHPTGFAMSAQRAAARTALWRALSCMWCRRALPVPGSTQRREAGKTYCHDQTFEESPHRVGARPHAALPAERQETVYPEGVRLLGARGVAAASNRIPVPIDRVV